MSQHFKRWATSLVGAPLLFILIIYSSQEVFFLFIVAIVQAAAWEYNRLVFEKQGRVFEKSEVAVFSFIISFSVYFGDFSLLISMMTFCLLISFIIFLYKIKNEEIDISELGKVVLGFMYMPVLVSYLTLLRQLPEGVIWVAFTLVIAFSGDIFGFYVGKNFGKKKLYPLVSPGKTVEGLGGLICGSALGSSLFQIYFFNHILPLGHAIFLGALGGVAGQLGDLFESSIKRSARVKDAGILFPGHGGILDRLDSISFIAPVVFFYQNFVLK